ncbi:hypothetical protein F5884DRAFT_821883 [Xylogone sp. PMI_703]|nr:hypothetical protein F5884DRAFT_821883 [Xylogone sp. PMI_703]
METASLSSCGQCGKQFQRKAHLLRHQLQHSGDRPYSCRFCSKTFKRSDVLRDHFSRCDRRGSSPIPNSLERGRKRHACDECSRLKVKCEDEMPCRKCREFGRICVRGGRPQGTPTVVLHEVQNSNVVPSAPPSPEEGSIHNPGVIAPENTHSDRNSVGFLLNFSAESEFLHEFPPNMNLEARIANFRNLMAVTDGLTPVVGEYATKVSPGYRPFGLLDTEKSLNELLSTLEFDGRNGNWGIQGSDPSPWIEPGSPMNGQMLLERRAFTIREALRHSIVKINMPHEPPNEVLRAVELITAYNLVLYTQLYFHHWHKNSPMVHHSTFNLFTAAIPLVLAILALGGMYSNNCVAIEKLKLLLDPIEDYFFSLPGWGDEYEQTNRVYRPADDSSIEWQQYQLEELQAGHLIIIIQYWTGNMVARCRVSQCRFQKWLTIARSQGLYNMTHPPDFVISDESSFRAWIRKESYIRTANISVIIDSTWNVFHNIAPRIQWTEMDFSLAGDDRAFQAANYQELMTYAGLPSGRPKLKEAFLPLFTPREKTDETMRRLKSANLTVFDMMILVHVIYTHVWASTFSSPLASFSLYSDMSPSITTIASHITAPFRSALTNWKKLWDDIKLCTDPQEWFKLGFQRSAETYYNVVLAVLKVYEEMRDRNANDTNIGGWWDIIGGMPSGGRKGEHLRKIMEAGSGA